MRTAGSVVNLKGGRTRIWSGHPEVWWAGGGSSTGQRCPAPPRRASPCRGPGRVLERGDRDQVGDRVDQSEEVRDLCQRWVRAGPGATGRIGAASSQWREHRVEHWQGVVEQRGWQPDRAAGASHHGRVAMVGFENQPDEASNLGRDPTGGLPPGDAHLRTGPAQSRPQPSVDGAVISHQADRRRCESVPGGVVAMGRDPAVRTHRDPASQLWGVLLQVPGQFVSRWDGRGRLADVMDELFEHPDPSCGAVRAGGDQRDGHPGCLEVDAHPAACATDADVGCVPTVSAGGRAPVRRRRRRAARRHDLGHQRGQTASGEGSIVDPAQPVPVGEGSVPGTGCFELSQEAHRGADPLGMAQHEPRLAGGSAVVKRFGSGGSGTTRRWLPALPGARRAGSTGTVGGGVRWRPGCASRRPPVAAGAPRGVGAR